MYKVSTCVLAALLSLQLVRANDAEVSYGGTPRLLHGHSKVRMLRERIQATVDSKLTKFRCDFWFKNEGPATELRMGFPDGGNTTEEADPGSRPTSNFRSFTSWVNGRQVPTRFLLGSDGLGWHVKTVRFGKGERMHVTEEYSADTGTAVMKYGTKYGGCNWVQYVVSTGASWNGPIGRTDIFVRFSKAMFPKGVRPVAMARVWTPPAYRDFRASTPPARGTVVYSGLAKAKNEGNTLRFTRTNWIPKPKDDLMLWFDFRRS